MLGLLANALRSLLTGGMAGLLKQTRPYTEWRGIIHPASVKPTTTQQAREIIQRHFKSAKKAGLLEPVNGVLTIMVAPEFGFNGYYLENGRLSADGSQPISREIFSAAALEAQSILKNEPPGLVYIAGTAMIDTGIKIDGSRLLENRGFVGSSGPNSDMIDFTKKNVDPLDNVGTGVTVVGNGPIVYSIKDVFGDGLTHYLAIAVCHDYAAELASGRVQFPIEPGLIVSPSAGWPDVVPPGGADVLVSDSFHNAFNMEIIDPNDPIPTNRSRVWEKVNKDPILRKLILFMSDPNSAAFPLMTWCGLTRNVTQALLDRVGRQEQVMSPLPYRVDKDKSYILTDTRPLPGVLTNDTMARVIVATEKDGASLLSGGIGQSETDSLVAIATDLGKGLPWDYLHDRLEARVNAEVVTALTGITDPFSLDATTLLQTISTPEMDKTIALAANDLIWEAASADPKLEDLVSKLNIDDAKAFLASIVVKPLVSGLGSSTDKASWISLAIEKSISTRRLHFSGENAKSIQENLAKLAEPVEETARELAASKDALAKVQAELDKKPGEPSLEQRAQQLSDEVKRLTEKHNAAEEKQQQAEIEEKKAGEDVKHDQGQASASAEREAEAARQVFHGE